MDNLKFSDKNEFHVVIFLVFFIRDVNLTYLIQSNRLEKLQILNLIN